MFEKLRDTLWEIDAIDDYEQKKNAIKLMIDMLVEEYGKTCLREERDKRLSEFIEKTGWGRRPKQIEFPHRWRPLRTVNEIVNMEPKEGWKHQYVYKLKNKTAWIASDDRFLHDGQS